MAVKPINELAPRTPAVADVLAVADPFNGQTGKSTISQISDSMIVPATYTYTGTEFYPLMLTQVKPPAAVLNGQTIINSSSPYLENISTISYSSYTSLTFPNLAGIGNGSGGDGVAISFASSTLTSLNFPALVFAREFNMNGVSLLNSLSVPLLKYVAGQFSINGAPISSLSAPELEYVMKSLTLYPSGSCVASFPKLKFAGDLTIYGSSIISVSAPLLEKTTLLQVGFAPGVTSINISNIREIKTVNFVGASPAPALSTLNIGSNLKFVGSNWVTTGCALNQASVDNILVRLAALDGTNGTTAYSNKTVNLSGGTSATPSSTGLAAKATLVARGCTVTHN